MFTLLAGLSGSAVLSDTVVALSDGASAVVKSPVAWVEIVVAIIGAAVTYVFIPYIRNKALIAKREAELSLVELNQSKLNVRDAILNQVKYYIYSLVESAAEREFPKLANRIISGELKDKEDIKKELRSWGQFVKVETIAYFKNQGVDIIEVLGDEAINAAVESAANSISPFRGKETAVALLEGGAKLLLEKGVEKVRELE